MKLLRAIGYECGFLALFLFVVPAILRRIDPILYPLPLDPLSPAGFLLLVAGFILAESCIALLLRRGRGTQAPFDHPRDLVTDGPYRYTRNPMALGFIAMLAGLALALASTAILIYALLTAAVVHELIVHREERELRRRFGIAWEAYAREVPRWL